MRKAQPSKSYLDARMRRSQLTNMNRSQYWTFLDIVRCDLIITKGLGCNGIYSTLLKCVSRHSNKSQTITLEKNAHPNHTEHSGNQFETLEGKDFLCQEKICRNNYDFGAFANLKVWVPCQQTLQTATL